MDIKSKATPIAGIYIKIRNGAEVFFADVFVEGRHYHSRYYETFEEALNALERIWARALKNKNHK